MRHPSLLPLLALLLLSLFAGLHPGKADEVQSRFDDIDFVRVSAGCGMTDRAKTDDKKGTLEVLPDPAEPFCDATGLSKYLRQLLHTGLLKPDSEQERSRDEIVRNDTTWAPSGGAKTLSISLLVRITKITKGSDNADLPAPIDLCTYVLERHISGPHSTWARSAPLTVVCGHRAGVLSTALAFAEPMLLDTIPQLRRAK